MRTEWKSERRNGYGAVDEYVDGKCRRTTITGLKPAKLADTIADLMNGAYETARDDALNGASLAILSGVAKRPTTFPAATIRENVAAIVEGLS